MKSKKGFTIIEILVMISALVIISLVAFSFMSVTLLNSGKALAVKEVRQNGNYALSVIERLIVSAKSVSCLTADSMEITSLNGNETPVIISCLGNRIASDSTAFLTNDKVTISNCNFVCTSTEGLPTSVGVGFTARIGADGSLASERSQISFQNQFLVRNQRD